METAIVMLGALDFALVYVVYRLAILVKAQDLAEFRNDTAEEAKDPYIDPLSAGKPFDVHNLI